MNWRKYLALLLAIVLSFLFVSSCRKAGDNSETTEGTTSADVVVTDNNLKENYEPNSDERRVVCLDAGHGFGDTGCATSLSSNYELERELTLVMTLELKTLLEKRGVTVFLSHNGEAFPSDSYLIEMAEKYGIEYDGDSLEENNLYSKNERALYTEILHQTIGLDLFVSLHINTVEDKPETVSGSTIDYYRDAADSEMLSSFSLKLRENLLKNDTVDSFVIYADSYEDSYAVTKLTSAPAVLIEVGYATNESDMNKMDNSEWRSEYLTVLADTIIQSTH